MTFTKTAIAVAIVGIAAAPMMVSADTTLSGAVQIQVRGSDADGTAGDPVMAADDVLVGVSASHELNSGLTGYGSLRLDMNRLSNGGAVTDDQGTPLDETDDFKVGSAGTADSVYVGIKGGFGDIRVGEVPNAVEYGQTSADIFDVAGEVNGGVSYTGSFGPASVIAQFSLEGNSEVVGLGAKFGVGGLTIGLGGETRAEMSNVAAGVSFALSGASVSAHVWSKEAAAGGDIQSFAVKVGYGFGGVAAGLSFTAQENDASIDQSAIRLDLSYGLGGGMDISTRIQSNTNNNDSSGDSSTWRVKLSKSF